MIDEIIGHGEEITDIPGVLKKHYTKYQMHEKKILSLLDVPTKVQTRLLGIMFYETLGKLDLLEQQGEVKVNNRDGILHYEKY